MADREKLIDALEETIDVCGTVENLADLLIAKGVTVQEWIPVTERLPEKECRCLVFTTIYFIPDHVDDCDHYKDITVCGYYPGYGFTGEGGRWATHWMPLPDPPDGDS